MNSNRNRTARGSRAPILHSGGDSRRRRTWAACGTVLAVAGALVLCVSSLASAQDATPLEWKWVYVQHNFQVNRSTDQLIELTRRAHAAGYNGVVIHDSKFARNPAERPPRYFDNVQRFRRVADELGMEIIPKVMPIGYSNGILSHNPNLAAAIPVRNCLFTVHDGRATIADGDNLLAGGGFESFQSGKPVDWDWGDSLGVTTVQDREQFHSGSSSLRMSDFEKGEEHGLTRVVKWLPLEPWRQYHVSVWIRTQDVAHPERMNILLRPDPLPEGGMKDLNRSPLGVRSTQDWTRHGVLFNTFEHSNIGLYVGAWGAGDGTIWIDDVSIRPVGGVNLLRRDGCPIHVTSDDGAIEYEEGRDFETWEYPQMGRVPFPGSYEIVHPDPPIVLTPDSRIRDRQRLRVSYYHTRRIVDTSVCCCLAAEELFEHLERQVRFMHDLFAPRTYLMNHDEIRLAGWCELCNSPDVTTGDLLAANVRRCTRIIRDVNPEAEILVWSDMFDPFHNAVDNYWYTRGTMRGSWEGLDPGVVIANWNRGHPRESLTFFAERGHPQLIAGYYDDRSVTARLHRWLRAAENVEGVKGVMYTTWSNDYRDLEAFIEALNEWYASGTDGVTDDTK
jgi:hypothetical protein